MGRNKYNASKKVVDGIKFDSTGEAARYKELLLLQDNGFISGLVLQPTFTISAGGIKDPATGRKMSARKYSADFMYYDVESGDLVVEDFKSVITAKDKTYRLKRQLFLEQYGWKYKFVEIY